MLHTLTAEKDDDLRRIYFEIVRITVQVNLVVAFFPILAFQRTKRKRTIRMARLLKELIVTFSWVIVLNSGR